MVRVNFLLLSALASVCAIREKGVALGMREIGLSELSVNTSGDEESGLPWVFRKMVDGMVQNSPSSVITGLFRSRLFNKALTKFLQESSFLEQMLLRNDLLTKALCGLQAKSQLNVGVEGSRIKTGEWNLRIYEMACDQPCRSALRAEVGEREHAVEGTFVSGSVDMPALLAQEGMAELFLKELAASPGLLEGLDAERMQESFGLLKIIAYPEVDTWFGTAMPASVGIKVRNMRNKCSLQRDHCTPKEIPEPQPSTLAHAIDALSSEALTEFVAGTLSGFTPALVSEAIMLHPDFPNVLNAALDPVKMNLWVEHIFSASADMQFITTIPRRSDVCPTE